MRLRLIDNRFPIYHKRPSCARATDDDVVSFTMQLTKEGEFEDPIVLSITELAVHDPQTVCWKAARKLLEDTNVMTQLSADLNCFES